MNWIRRIYTKRTNRLLFPLPLCDENAEFLGFGGSFGVVSPGEKLGEVFELKETISKMFSLKF